MIVDCAPPELTLLMAVLNEPAPESFVLVTKKVQDRKQPSIFERFAYRSDQCRDLPRFS